MAEKLQPEEIGIRIENGRVILELQAVIRIPIYFEKIARRVVPGDVQLTARETQVLDGILKGLCNKDIANGIGIAERTVKHFASQLYEKFNVATRSQLAMLFQKDEEHRG